MSADPAEIPTIVGLQLGREEVLPEHRLFEDLGAESGDFVAIVAIVEERYGIFIEEEELPAIRTVADLQRLARERSSGP